MHQRWGQSAEAETKKSVRVFEMISTEIKIEYSGLTVQTQDTKKRRILQVTGFFLLSATWRPGWQP